MRTWATVVSILIVVAAPALAHKEESLQELKGRAESARLEDRPSLCIEIAKRQLKAADQLYTEGKVEEGRAAVQDIVTYSEQATAAATKTGKKLKNTEIAVRKIAERLRDIKRSLSFEDQQPVHDAAERLEHLRSQLLSKMFGSGSKD